jgi:hypothetical protein
MKAFTGEQLAALLIGERMKVTVCFFCHRFATRGTEFSGDQVCDREECAFKLTTLYRNVVGIKFNPNGQHDLASRLNATIWDD